MLQRNPWDGGCGYTPKQIGELTPDQVYFCVADKKILRSGNSRTDKYTSEQTASIASDKEGNIKGRDKDGNPLNLKMEGESLARRLMREEAEKAAQEAAKKRDSKKRRRRRRRGG